VNAETRVNAVHESVHVECSVEDAFTYFTTRIGEWWPLERASYGGDRAKHIFLEPHIGGRFFERFVDGDELQVGTVIACDPPDRIIFSWQAAEWEAPTEVEVTFTPTDEGTDVHVEHRGFERIGSLGPQTALKFGSGWPGVLQSFASGIHSRS
jgi:uncharacterized protein YndB with AHSA1/START domain